MKKEFIKVAKEMGFDKPIVIYTRPERDAVVYYLTIYKNGVLLTDWNIGYFIGEVDTANSKDRIIPEFREFLKNLLNKI